MRKLAIRKFLVGCSFGKKYVSIFILTAKYHFHPLRKVKAKGVFDLSDDKKFSTYLFFPKDFSSISLF